MIYVAERAFVPTSNDVKSLNQCAPGELPDFLQKLLLLIDQKLIHHSKLAHFVDVVTHAIRYAEQTRRMHQSKRAPQSTHGQLLSQKTVRLNTLFAVLNPAVAAAHMVCHHENHVARGWCVNVSVLLQNSNALHAVRVKYWNERSSAM